MSGNNKLVAVAIDKDKGSQGAIKWAVDSILRKGQTVLLIHIKLKSIGSATSAPSFSQRSSQISDINDETGSLSGDVVPETCKELFLPFLCFCRRKDIQCQDVVLEDTDVAKALIQYVTESAIEVLVLGAGSKSGLLRRFKAKDIPGSVLKGLPEFCTAYVISKGKISTTRSASRSALASAPLRNQILHQSSSKSDTEVALAFSSKGVPRPPSEQSLKLLLTEVRALRGVTDNLRRGQVQLLMLSRQQTRRVDQIAGRVDTYVDYTNKVITTFANCFNVTGSDPIHFSPPPVFPDMTFEMEEETDSLADEKD